MLRDCPLVYKGLQKNRGTLYGDSLEVESILSMLLTQNSFSKVDPGAPLCTGSGSSNTGAFESAESANYGCILDLPVYGDTVLALHYFHPRISQGLWQAFEDKFNQNLDNIKSSSTMIRIWLPLLMACTLVAWMMTFIASTRRFRRSLAFIYQVPSAAIARNSMLASLNF